MKPTGMLYVKELIVAIGKNVHKIAALSILAAVTSLIFVFAILPALIVFDAIIVLVIITGFVVFGLFGAWYDSRFTAKYGNIERGYG